MITLVIRYWKIILDCLIVIALILAFTFWDPFDIFNTRKIRQTAILVTGVRDIGELVTAEYYGEVIASWKEFALIGPPDDTVTYWGEDMYLKLKHSFSEIRRQDVNGNAAMRGLDTKSKDAYTKFIAFLGTKFLRRGLDRIYDEDKKRIKGSLEERILKSLYDEVQQNKDRLSKGKNKDAVNIKNAVDRYLDSIPTYIDEFSNFYTMLSEKDVFEGRDSKKEIVFVGRGWVKAGFRFDTFGEQNFVYDKISKTVHFYGLSPVILDKDINPWFIPERKVKGFELVRFSGNAQFYDAKNVKKLCKEKLLKQAGVDILKRAQENGAEALRNFFSLLLDEPDLKVAIHDMPFEREYAAIASDSLITTDEALTIGKLYADKISIIHNDTFPAVKQRHAQQLAQFITKLKKLHFIEHSYTFNFFSIHAARILADSSHVNENDIHTIITLRDTLRSGRDSLHLTTGTISQDSLWFINVDGVAEYHEMLRVIFQKCRSMSVPHEPFHIDDLKYDVETVRPDTSVITKLKKGIRTIPVYSKTLLALRDKEAGVITRVMDKRNKRDEALSPLNAFSDRIRKIADQLKNNL